MTTLDPPARLLCGPGPSDVEPAVLDAMRRPMLGHLDPAFHAILDAVVAMLRDVWRMPEGDVFALPSTGTAAMEAGIVNLLAPGDVAIVAEARLSAVAWATWSSAAARARSACRRRGARRCRTPSCWRRSRASRTRGSWPSCTRRPRRAPSTRCEELADVLNGRDALLMADCVTSLGGVPLEAGAWGVDYAYSCTQKCLAAPPGMAPVAISPRAWERIAQRRGARSLLARPRAAARLLGHAARRLPPHRACARRLRAPRGAAARARGGSQGALGAPFGRGRAPAGRGWRSAGWSCSPTLPGSSRRSPRFACRRESTARRSRLACWPSTGSRSVAGSARPPRRCGGSA